LKRKGCFCYCFATLETLEHNQKQKMHSLNGATLTPAYGRDYTSGKDAIASFESGKDFSLASIFHGSGYVSVRDFACGDRVSIRYGKLRKVVGHTVKGGAE
jgi:hypothetical protein